MPGIYPLKLNLEGHLMQLSHKEIGVDIFADVLISNYNL